MLNNLESYLVEEEVRMRKLDEKCEYIDSNHLCPDENSRQSWVFSLPNLVLILFLSCNLVTS